MTTADLDGRLERAAEQVKKGTTIPLLVRPRGAPVVDARYVRVRLPGEDEPGALSQAELAALLVLAGRGEVALGWPFIPDPGGDAARAAPVSPDLRVVIQRMVQAVNLDAKSNLTLLC